MDERDELLRAVRRAREHLTWLEGGGIDRVPRRKGFGPGIGGHVLPAPPPEPEPVAAPPPAPDALSRSGRAGLEAVRAELGDCRRCKLCEGRKNIVFGVGDPDAKLVFIGEGPGMDEDRQGEPFVGKAGQLLNKMIEAMGLAREQVYICNVVKCHPPGPSPQTPNRAPDAEEVAACEPFLKGQLEAIRPRVLVALGGVAAKALLRTSTGITALRGQWKTYQGIPLMPTYHPAFLLRSPENKADAWSDLKQVMAELDRLGAR